MADEAILRFVNPDDLDEVGLELNDGERFIVGPNFDVGSPGLEKVSLFAPGIDGEDRVSDRRTNAVVTIPLVLPQTDEYTYLETSMAILNNWLERPETVLEWRPTGSIDSLYMDTRRADFLPTLTRGQTIRPDCILFDGYLVAQLERLPWMRFADGTLIHR